MIKNTIQVNAKSINVLASMKKTDDQRNQVTIVNDRGNSINQREHKRHEFDLSFFNIYIFMTENNKLIYPFLGWQGGNGSQASLQLSLSQVKNVNVTFVLILLKKEC